MAEQDKFLRQRFGGMRSTTDAAVLLRRGMRSVLNNMYTAAACVVTAYDRDNMRVDVVLKATPPGLSPEYFDVPMASAGEVAHVPDIRTLNEATSENGIKPTVGLLIFTREDCRDAWDTHFQKAPCTQLKHRGLSPIFLPGPLVLNDDLPLPSDIQEGDDVFLDRRTGSHTIYRRDGDMIMRASKKLYVGKVGQLLQDMKAAARKGDAVAHPGPIVGGSENVFVGD